MNKTVSWFRIVLLGLAVMAVFLWVNQAISRRTGEMEEMETELRVELSELQEDTSRLRSSIAQVGTENYIENEARSRYGFIKTGELRYAFTNPEALDDLTDAEYAIWKKETGE